LETGISTSSCAAGSCCTLDDIEGNWGGKEILYLHQQRDPLQLVLFTTWAVDLEPWQPLHWLDRHSTDRRRSSGG
jgi:hypothetical protein